MYHLWLQRQRKQEIRQRRADEQHRSLQKKGSATRDDEDPKDEGSASSSGEKAIEDPGALIRFAWKKNSINRKSKMHVVIKKSIRDQAVVRQIQEHLRKNILNRMRKSVKEEQKQTQEEDYSPAFTVVQNKDLFQDNPWKRTEDEEQEEAEEAEDQVHTLSMTNISRHLQFTRYEDEEKQIEESFSPSRSRQSSKSIKGNEKLKDNTAPNRNEIVV